MKIDKRRLDPFRRMSRSLALAASAIIMTAAAPAPEAAIHWDAKNAYRKCDGAIDGVMPWPVQPEATCVAMLMCANEAVLSAERHRRLIERIRLVPGCAEP